MLSNVTSLEKNISQMYMIDANILIRGNTQL